MRHSSISAAEEEGVFSHIIVAECVVLRVAADVQMM
jgi:hypothetical protein